MKRIILLLFIASACALQMRHTKSRAQRVAPRNNDPEAEMKADEIIRHWGYPAEDVTVTTADGYVLEMHRIPYGKAGPGAGNPCRPVVFFQHGLEGDSTNFIMNPPDESPAFIFADAGFDVWIGNMRGNTYGKSHISLNPNDEKFWKFTWDEMQQYDLKAMIDKALAVTKASSLYYVGHSQGTLTMFSKLSDDPTMAPKIKKFFALAPVGSVKHIKGLVKIIEEYFLPLLDVWYDLFGTGEFGLPTWVTELIAELLCNNDVGDQLCDDLLFLTGGPETSQFNRSRSDVYFAHFPSGTSTKNVMHWAQMVHDGTVSRFDYGDSQSNQHHYGTSKPPSYDFTTIKTDMYLYWSDDDYLADATDVKEYLLTSLNPNYVKGNFHLAEYNHFDFVLGMRAPKEIFHPIVDIITQDLGGKVQCATTA